MALILHIDTATLNANIAIAKNGKMLSYQEAGNEKTIAFLHTAISHMLRHTELTFDALDAVMIHSGPGSYTGLRIGFSAAKGIVYAMQKKLITASSFDILSHLYFTANPLQEKLLIIDNARADEWYFQYFEKKKPLQEACIKTTDEVLQCMNTHPTEIISIHDIEKSIFEKKIVTLPITSIQMMDLGELLFEKKQFTNIYHSEPFYCKAAYVK